VGAEVEEAALHTHTDTDGEGMETELHTHTGKHSHPHTQTHRSTGKCKSIYRIKTVNFNFHSVYVPVCMYVCRCTLINICTVLHQ